MGQSNNMRISDRRRIKLRLIGAALLLLGIPGVALALSTAADAGLPVESDKLAIIAAVIGLIIGRMARIERKGH